MNVPSYVYDLIASETEGRWGASQPLGSPITVTYSFLTSVPVNVPGNPAISSFTAFNTTEIQATRDALAAISDLTNLTFTELASGDTSANMRFGNADLGGGAGIAYTSRFSSTGFAQADIFLANNGSTPISEGTFQPGSIATNDIGGQSWTTLLHEIGHALGLKHPFETNYANDPNSILPTADDNEVNSVMSYTAFTPANIAVAVGGGSYLISALNSSTFGSYDIAALQHLYGTDTSSTGNKTVTFQPDAPIFTTFSDTGPNNKIDASALTGTNTVDLRAGARSNLAIEQTLPFSLTNQYDGTGALTIAYTASVATYLGGSGSDTVTGNTGNNRLLGNAAIDILKGEGGKDWIQGGSGGDTATGGTGTDWFAFDASVSNAGDTITDYLAGDVIYFAGTAAVPTVTTSGSTASVNGVNVLNATAGDIEIVTQISTVLLSSGTAVATVLADGYLALDEAAGAQVRSVFDTDSDAPWLRSSNGYDAQGRTNYQDTIYDAGNRIFKDFDQASNNPWSTKFTFFTASAETEVVRDNFDTGGFQVTYYDYLVNQTWTTKIDTYNTALARDFVNFYNDNGTRKTIDFDQASDQEWSTREVNYTPGNQAELLITFYDDNSSITKSFDPSNSSNTEEIIVGYDSLRRADYINSLYDDGSRIARDFDQADQFSWAEHILVYDMSGTLVNDYYI